MRKLVPLLLLVSVFPVVAQTPYLVKDLNTVYSPSAKSSSPTEFQLFQGRVYFVATTDAAGTEIWSSDGTSGTASLLADIFPGPGSSYPYGLTVVNGVMLFVASDVNHGSELWATDGSAAGTRMLVDINPGPGSSYIDWMFVDGNRMFFSANDGTSGTEPWVTDGTAAGTHRLKDIAPGIGSSSPMSFASFAGSVYFSAAGGVWKTDGTDSGTVKIAPVPAHNLTAAGNHFFFDGFTAAAGWELYVSDGTSGGTHMVADLWPGASNAFNQAADGIRFAALGNRVLFNANDGVRGEALWVSDGTQSGTQIIHEFPAGVSGPWNRGYPYLTTFNGRVFFSANDGDHGDEVWVTDGTAAGTSLFDDVVPGAGSSLARFFVPSGNQLFFVGVSTLWVSDGTTAGTHSVQPPTRLDVNVPAVVTALGGKVYYNGYTGLNGIEPWVSDGTEAGTHLVANLAPDAAASSQPICLTSSGNLLYFFANTLPVGGGFLIQSMLCRSDGTAAGTFPLTPVSTFADTIYPTANGVLVPTGVGSVGSGWAVSDGTVAGTKSPDGLLSHFPTPPYYGIKNVYAFGDALYLSVFDDSDNNTLWRASLGSNDPPVSLGIHNVSSFIDSGGRKFAIGRASAFGNSGLWTTDGTPSGTYAIVPNLDGDTLASYTNLLSVRGTLYFLQNTVGQNAKLWKSDGTFEGTVVVKTLPPSDPGDTKTATAGGKLFFVQGTTLWVSDGTSDGTTPIGTAHFNQSSNFATLFFAGDHLVFVNDDSASHHQLWGTDGTSAGTKLLAALDNLLGIASIDGQVWFNGVDAAHGSEVWVSDGTVDGTRLVADVNPGAASSGPEFFAKVGSTLYFNATTADAGTELWGLPLNDVALSISDTRVAEGDSGSVVAQFNVTLTSPAKQSVTVAYATSDGTAHAGDDYDATSGTLTFAPGETSKTIDVNVHGDTLLEPNETFFVTLSNASGGARIHAPVGAGVIEDDDETADLSISHLIDFAHENSVAVTNLGPSAATNIGVTFTFTPVGIYGCGVCHASIPQLTSGATANAAVQSAGAFEQIYASAAVTARQRDPWDVNNFAAWTFAEGIVMVPSCLVPGQTGVITADAFNTSFLPAANSSDPSVVSLSAVVRSSSPNDRVTVVATGLRPGSSTITIGTYKLTVLVSAPGTIPRWPGALSVSVAPGVVYFDQPVLFTVLPTGAAPFTGERGTGTVTVSLNGQQLSSRPIGSGQSYSYYAPTLGELVYEVDYSGDATFQPQTLFERVSILKGRLTLNALLEPVAASPGSFSLRVGTEGSPVSAPTGTLSVQNGGSEIAKLTLNATGGGNAAAQTVLANLPSSPTLTIVYSGDSFYNEATTSVRALQPHRRAVHH